MLIIFFAYVLYRKQFHLLAKEVCTCRWLCDPYQRNLHQYYIFLEYRLVDILFEYIWIPQYSHISDQWHIHCRNYSQPLCKQAKDCLEVQVDKHKLMYGSQPHKWLECHIVWLSRD